jgi:hypothetical protein
LTRVNFCITPCHITINFALKIIVRTPSPRDPIHSLFVV